MLNTTLKWLIIKFLLTMNMLIKDKSLTIKSLEESEVLEVLVVEIMKKSLQMNTQIIMAMWIKKSLIQTLVEMLMKE